jgi:methylmalonyl-CoA/ethylmalonyl-CoA epimerase
MFLRVEHIGLAIANLDEANALFARLFGKAAYKDEVVKREGVTTSFFQIGQEAKIELLGANHEGSPIAKYLDKRGPGIHHLAFEVDDIRAEMARLKAEGFELLADEPKEGADNKLIAFLHPKSTGVILVELCQDKG